MIYFTADLHWGDERMELLGRHYVDAREAQLDTLAHLQRTLKDDDELYVNGDIAMDEEWLKPIQDVRGKKHLIRGNYDRLWDETYLKYFDSVHKQILIVGAEDPAGLSDPMNLNVVHYPGMSVPDAFNLTAHIHGCWRVQKNMLNVGIDCWYMRPVPITKVFFMYRGIINFYDQDVWVAEHEANVPHKVRGKTGTYWQNGFLGTRDGAVKA